VKQTAFIRHVEIKRLNEVIWVWRCAALALTVQIKGAATVVHVGFCERAFHRSKWKWP